MGKKSKPQSPMGMPQQGMPMQPPAGGQAPPPQMMTPSGQGGFAPPRQMPQQGMPMMPQQDMPMMPQQGMPMMPPQAQGHAYGRMGQMNPQQMERIQQRMQDPRVQGMIQRLRQGAV